MHPYWHIKYFFNCPASTLIHKAPKTVRRSRSHCSGRNGRFDRRYELFLDRSQALSSSPGYFLKPSRAGSSLQPSHQLHLRLDIYATCRCHSHPWGRHHFLLGGQSTSVRGHFSPGSSSSDVSCQAPLGSHTTSMLPHKNQHMSDLYLPFLSHHQVRWHLL